MKNVLLSLITLCTSFYTLAQEKKISLSLELNPKLTGVAGTSSSVGEQQSAFSLGVNAIGTYHLSKTIGLGFGIGYELSNFHYRDMSITAGSDIDPTTGINYENTYLDKKLTRHYVTIPLRLSFDLGSEKGTQVFLGFGIHVPVSQSQKGEVNSKSDPSFQGTYDNYPQKDPKTFVNTQLGLNKNFTAFSKKFYAGIKLEHNTVNMDYLNSFGFTTSSSLPGYYLNMGITLGYLLN